MKKQTDSACRISGVADSVSGVACRVSSTPRPQHPKSSIFNLQSSILALLLLAGTAQAAATDYYVAANGVDSNDGLGWATPLLTISNGVAKATAAGAGSTVTVSNGTYNISVEIAITAAITVRSFGNGVTGGMANAAATIVKGGTGNQHIFVVTADATVDGFTMRDAQRASGTMLGGGVYVNSSGAVVQNCIMTANNGDTMYGCGAYVVAGLVRNCTILNNGNADRINGANVYMTGGTVSNCVITGGSANAGGGTGGGAYMTGGLLVSCRIYGNYDTGDGFGGGGVYMNGGTVRNCLITGNYSDPVGGGVRLDNGTIESSTIVGNSTGNASGGGGIYRNGGTAGTVMNCIVLNNTSGHATYKNSYSSTSGWTYNCTTLPDVAGTGCTNGNPLFRDTTEGNYQLSVGSPCIDTGQDQGWMPGATDLAGNARKQDIPGVGTASVDMGAYEYVAALTCDFLASPRALIAAPTTYQSFGPAPLTVQFTGWTDGTNLTGLIYRWDFDNDGNYEQEGLNLTNVSYTYNTVGVYSPRLQVTNSTAEVAERIKTNYVSAGTTHYVVTNNPTAAAPYTSWATAASNNIQAAVNQMTLNGSQVIITNGTYGITSQITNINVATVRSFEGGLSGASNTVVQRSGGTTRIFFIGNSLAVVQGVTIRGGSSGANGGGVYLTAGLVRDCIIRDNNAGDNVFAGGVYMTGGTVSNCVIRSNSSGAGTAGAGGVYASGGQLLFCQITDNGTSGNNPGGGVLMPTGGSATLRNCLIARNSTTQTGGGVYLGAGTVESCTIVTNSATSASGGGGIYRNGSTAGTVLNCIVYNNVAPNNATYKNSYSGTSGWTYNDTALPDVAGTGCINGMPMFTDAANSDYRIKACAAVDSGANQTSWMTGALDLAGAPRIVNSIVDMGAYEYVPGALECALAANATTVLAPANVIFTATVAGSNLTSLAYTWTFGDGNSTNGAGLGVVTNLYSTPGVYTVTLTVTNSAGEVAADTNTSYVAVWSTNAYVWTNSPSPAAPYTNWATAARLIGTAVAAAPAGVTLWATNGTYNETGEILVNKGVTVRSVAGNLSGASNTIVRASVGFSYRLFSLSDANAVLQGLTIQDTALGANGCGVNMSAGLVRDCIIRNNGFCDNHLGSGVYMSGGTVSNCVVKNNGGGSNANGSGIYADGGQILYCQILDNALNGGEGASAGGAGIYANGPLIRNCLIARNSAGGTAGGGTAGGGVYLAAGTIESCTIVSNSANGPNGGGGVYRGSGTAGTVLNSIVYNNTAANNATYQNFYKTSDANVTYTCTTNPVVAGTGCIPDNPLFFNPDAGDFSLKTTSPCIDAGSNQTWMTGATDLAGNNRLIKGNKVGVVIVDMGAYETYVPARGTAIMFR